MLAGSEALVKPSELMRSLGPIPPGNGGSAEQGQGGLEGGMGSTSRGFWSAESETVPCSSPWMGPRSWQGRAEEHFILTVDHSQARRCSRAGWQEGSEGPGVGNSAPRGEDQGLKSQLHDLGW